MQKPRLMILRKLNVSCYTVYSHRKYISNEAEFMPTPPHTSLRVALPAFQTGIKWVLRCDLGFSIPAMAQLEPELRIKAASYGGCRIYLGLRAT